MQLPLHNRSHAIHFASYYLGHTKQESNQNTLKCYEIWKEDLAERDQNLIFIFFSVLLDMNLLHIQHTVMPHF